MTNFTNRSALKRHLLNRILVVNPGAGSKFTRVSAQAIEDLEIKFLRVTDDYLRAQRIGKTITTP
jgi:2-keto-3-deoxy-galactonokinase